MIEEVTRLAKTVAKDSIVTQATERLIVQIVEVCAEHEKAALRQRADEAMRAEGNETLKEIEIMRVWWSEAGHTDDGEIYGQAIEVVKVLDHIAAAIRARIAP